MNSCTKLELAVLHSIFSECPELTADLKRQAESANVTKRRNTGCGFFTTMAVSSDAPRMSTPRVLGHETHARVHGLEHGLGFVLFMRKGRMHLLEGYAYGSESTVPLDLFDLTFEVYKVPVRRIG